MSANSHSSASALIKSMHNHLEEVHQFIYALFTTHSDMPVEVVISSLPTH